LEPKVLTVKSLACERGERLLFKNLNFTVQAGKILQLTGINGAGKSSLLRMLAGLSTPYTGAIHWREQNLIHLGKAYSSEICYLEHVNGLKDSLSALENLEFIGRLLYNRGDKTELLDILRRLNLYDSADTLVEQLSAGQKRRLALARLLMTPAKLWILDEPFTSLDAASIGLVEDLLTSHSQRQGITVIATHQLLSMVDSTVITYELLPC
jgi:heme exporter protein A